MLESPLLKSVSGYIDGTWVTADDGNTIEVHNPATGELLAEVPDFGPVEAERAVDAASRAFERRASLEERKGWLESIASALLENKVEIGRILTSEHGKPWKEAQGEVEYAAGFFRFCAENISVLAPRTLEEKPKGCSWTVHQRPAGVAALLTPWNFPIGMIAKKLSAALAADCPSIIKPSLKTPLTMIALFTLLDEKLDLPPGKVNLVLGKPKPIGDLLLEHPAVKILSFTGSTQVGKYLIEKSADQVKRLTLELGGNAPFIIFDDADLDSAADHLVANKFRGGGQTCVCANRVFVHRQVLDAFSAKLVERVEAMKMGDGMKEDTDIGPLIDRSGFDKVRKHVDDAVEHGAEVLAGGNPEPPSRDHGFFHPPTVLRGVTEQMVCTKEETFGPLVPLMSFESEGEVIERANDTEFGLAAYLFTADADRANRVIERLEFGHVGYNTGTGPTPEAPFGGMKHSGYGREGGIEGLHDFIEPQTVPTPV